MLEVEPDRKRASRSKRKPRAMSLPLPATVFSRRPDHAARMTRRWAGRCRWAVPGDASACRSVLPLGARANVLPASPQS